MIGSEFGTWNGMVLRKGQNALHQVLNEFH